MLILPVCLLWLLSGDFSFSPGTLGHVDIPSYTVASLLSPTLFSFFPVLFLSLSCFYASFQPAITVFAEFSWLTDV